MGHKISKEQIDPGVKDYIMSFVGDVTDLETEVNTDIISAVNSLMVDRVDNAENMGKLANAIGEPVTANHSVDEVVEGLGEMLSTFKTNMMNSGVMVEGSDKFKQLIDKIKSISGEGSGSLQYAEVPLGDYSSASGTFSKTFTFEDIGFLPSLYFLHITNIDEDVVNICVPNGFTTDCLNQVVIVTLKSITPTSLVVQFKIDSYMPEYIFALSGLKLIAIGIGEEDTTLRDSLASILTEEGVNVTEEDTMASLIIKVDEEFDRKNENLANSGSVLDIISATELPATGRENQICVITDNPVNNFLTSINFNDKNTVTNENIIFIYENPLSCLLPLQMDNNGITNNCYINTIYQGNTILSSYIYQNNNWNQLTEDALNVISYEYYNNDVFGNMALPSQNNYGDSIAPPLVLNSEGLVLNNYNYSTVSCVTTNQIDFNKYSKARISYKSTGVASYNFYFIIAENSTSHSLVTIASTSNVDSAYNSSINAAKSITISKANDVNKEYSVEIDISSFTHVSELRLVFFCSSASFSGVYKNSGGFVITKIELY